LNADHERPCSLPDGVAVERWGGAAPVEDRAGLKRFGWLLDRRIPAELASVDYSGVREVFQRWARPHYDLVWMGNGPTAFAALGDLVHAPIVANLDDIEDAKLDSRAQALRGRSGRVRAVVDPVLHRLWAARWRSFYARLAR